MSTIRDALLPVASNLRGLPSSPFGLRRFIVILRRRVWSGQYVNDGTVTTQDITITPLPRVRNSFSSRGISPAALEYILQNGTVILDRLYTIDKITPAFVNNGTPGGYSSAHLNMRPNPDVKNVDPVVILVGDDGYARECVQMSLEQDRAFHYKMLVRESDRPRTALVSLAMTPSSPTVDHTASVPKVQIAGLGTFEDGQTSDLSPICIWSTSNPTVATVDLLGVVTGVSAGTATITAQLGSVTASVSLTVT